MHSQYILSLVQLTVDEKRNAEAAEEAQMTAIASAIEHLPVEDGTARLSAAEWVLAPGEMETEGVETSYLVEKLQRRMMESQTPTTWNLRQ